MKTNLINSVILFCSGLMFVCGCGGSAVESSTGGDHPNEQKVERGRLSFIKSVTALNLGRDPIYRDVKQDFYVNGKKWSPVDETEFAAKINWCDTSPNPKVEILRCFGGASENYQTTYILRMQNDAPELQKIDEGLPNVWANDDGRWLLFSKIRLNVETGEKVDMKVISLAGQTAEVLPSFVIGVSPDLKTIVELPDSATKKEGAEEFLTLWIIDTETGKTAEQKASLTKYPWLTDHKDPDKDIQPPPAPSKKFVWEKDADGRDGIVVPHMSEK